MRWTNLKSLFFALTGGVTIKLPAAYDIAGSYESVPVWSALNPKPLIVFHKATEGNYYRDAKLAANFAGMKANGIKRGAYHFFITSIPADAQARYFCDYIAPIIEVGDWLVLDAEDTGLTAAPLKVCLDIIKVRFPKNPLMIYSRKNLLDPIPMTEAQKAYFKQIPVWTAGYPSNPDLYNSPPTGQYGYVPDQTKWGKVYVWQYSENGIVKGINGEVDLDWLAPEFIALLGAPLPPADVVTYPHNGMKQITGTRNGWKFHLFVIDRVLFDFELVATMPPNLETVPSVAKRKGATLAVNAGEWVRETLKPQDYTVSNGQEIVTRDKAAARPSFQIANGLPLISHLNGVNVLQSFTGLRYLLGTLANSTSWNSEGHARTCFGLDAAGNVIILVSEGVHPTTTYFDGLTLFEARDVLKEYGAVIAFDGGGGGDTGGVLDGVDLVKPENIVNGVNVYRYLPMTLCFYAKEGTMDGIAKEKYGSQTRVRKTPSRYGEIVRTLAGYAEVNFTEKVPTVSQGTADKAGEMWLKLTDGNYVNYKLFNSMNMLTDYFTIVQEPSVTPPPATFAHHLEVILDGVVEFTKDFN
jgi:lysozyme